MGTFDENEHLDVVRHVTKTEINMAKETHGIANQGNACLPGPKKFPRVRMYRYIETGPQCPISTRTVQYGTYTFVDAG